jgi:spermidine/putrescine transport system ATP-binding protein
MSLTGNIELKNVTKRFGTVTAVDAVSLQMRGGEFFSLLGPSGCGKTTTLRLIAGFEPPTVGEIYLDGQAMGQTPAHRRNVNTVFQNYALFPHLSVEENIAFGLKMKRTAKHERKRRVHDMLALVKLTGYGERRPSELSGGQQQRVALARALVNHPAILLLDEPLAALDLKLRKQMQLELKSLQRTLGITFVYVTHDQGEALSLSDHIAVMQNGKVLQVGTPSELYEHPNCHFVADFIGHSNFFRGVVLEYDGNLVGIRMSEISTPVIVQANERLQPHTEVMIAVRPERISLSPTASVGGLNQLRGTVEEVMYLGTLLQYTVAIAKDLHVIIHQPNFGSQSAQRYERGAPVYLSWMPEHGVVLMPPKQAKKDKSLEGS